MAEAICPKCNRKFERYSTELEKPPCRECAGLAATLYLERKAAADLANRKAHPDWPQYHGNVEQQKDRFPERERER